MIKQFKLYIKHALESFMASKSSDFDPLYQKMSIKNLMVYARRLDSGVNGFICIRFVKDRDYVIPTLRWSRLDELPEEEHMPVGNDRVENYFQQFDDREELCLSLCHFGRSDNSIDIENFSPSLERLGEIFDKKEHAHILADWGIHDWRTDDMYHSWSMIETLFPDEINQRDIEYACNQVVDDLKETITEKFIPYINQLNTRLQH